MVLSIVSFEDLFVENLRNSFKKNGVEITPSIEKYIAELFTNNLMKDGMKEPNFLLAHFALGRTEDPEVFAEIKNVADYLMVHLGYFPESLASKKYYSLDHYFDLGRKSYYNLSKSAFGRQVFSEVFLNYDHIIFSINETADSLSNYTDREMLITHQCWQKTGHKIFQNKLVRMGLITNSIDE